MYSDNNMGFHATLAVKLRAANRRRQKFFTADRQTCGRIHHASPARAEHIPYNMEFNIILQKNQTESIAYEVPQEITLN